MSNRFCIVSGCPRQLSAGSKSDMCPTCKSGLRYWDKKPYADVVAHQQRLSMLSSRMDMIQPKRRGKSVVASRGEARSEARH